MDVEDKDKVINVDVVPANLLTPNTNTYRQRWDEENRRRIMDWASFKDKDLVDVVLGVVVYISAPMFITSVGLTVLNPALWMIVTVGIILIILAFWWAIAVVPESLLLVVARLILIGIGIALGGSL
jgi:uncharacterized protein YqhQ